MGQDRQRNTTLESVLREAGMSHRDLARAVTAALREFGVPGECGERRVRSWVSGAVRWPTGRYLLALQTVLGKEPEQLGFVPRGAGSRVPAPPPRPYPHRKEVPVLLRRRVLTAVPAVTAAAAVTRVLGLDDTPVRGRLGMSDIERIREKGDRLAAHFTAVGGGALYDVADAYLERLRAAVEGCTYGPRAEAALHAEISALACTAGWAAADCGRRTTAGRLYAEALTSATLAGSPAARARAWSNLAMRARSSGRARQAVQLGRAALDQRPADPRLTALLHSNLALGHARAGDPGPAGRCLHRAELAYDRADTAGPAPVWLTFLDPSELAGLAALTHRALGRYAAAEDGVRQALDLLPPAMRRSRAYYSVQRAEIQLVRGHRDAAAETVAGIDLGALEMPRVAARLTAVHRHLGERP